MISKKNTKFSAFSLEFQKFNNFPHGRSEQFWTQNTISKGDLKISSRSNYFCTQLQSWTMHRYVAIFYSFFLAFVLLKTARSRHSSVNIVTWLCGINKLLDWNYSGKFKHFICMLTTLASFGLLTMTHQSMADYYGISVVTLKKYKRFDGYFTSHQLQSFLRNNTHKNSKHLKKSSCK